MKKTVELKQLKFSSLDEDLQSFLRLSVNATEKSFAPYSEFYVGCAVELADGEIVLGANQENSSFPSGLCAERVALFQCAKDLQNKVKRIVVHAKSEKYEVPNPLVPCAGCLQVISDIRNRQKQAIEIWMWDGKEDVFMADDVQEFLPFHFELKKNEA
ncbi:cytidine deaminase [Arcticibacterium luteifluviistationis]|uniref:Cytidine deaminase n=1 Tax=Arcticibacterium luteifluviistationis TaxID=1784714 RepID=A0A2Z4GCN6_9BACT|nr:cytidine deaminase [Arcticibacterium luteifluviistationis]AWV98828.1 cytidine deaminase [Arcticibacterium luteifluviistationis]